MSLFINTVNVLELFVNLFFLTDCYNLVLTLYKLC